MKTFKTLMLIALILCPALIVETTAQEENRPGFVIMTRTHWNFDVEATDELIEEWEAMETEYLDKVIRKNEHIMSALALQHYYTGDNTELILVSTYKTWDDIAKAQERTMALEEEGWPDEAARKEFFRKMDNNYVNIHSDEIYRTIPGAKFPPGEMDTSMVVYIQKVHRAFPEDGTSEEFDAVRAEYTEKVIHKNPYVVAYYPLRHAWGSDNREMLHIYVVSSLCDIEAMNQSVGGLVEAAWPDEAARKAFMDKYNKYFTGVHGDYIYTTIPEMTK